MSAVSTDSSLAMSAAVPQASDATVRDYIALLKPRVMTLVVFCGAVGMFVAPGALHPFLQFVTVLCIALATGASGALNMWYERDIDALMQRTKNRPVAAGRILPSDALAFGSIIATASVLVMGLAVNWTAASLLLLAITIYVGIYTFWLKRRTPQNIVIGGASGALPPAIGWVAVTGTLSIEAFSLFLIIFLWTPAHFWALALYKSQDYAKAGVPMLPVVASRTHCLTMIFLYAAATSVAAIFPYMLGVFGGVYLYTALLLSAGFVAMSARLRFYPSQKRAMQLFSYSMLYLFVLFFAMWADARFVL